MHRLTLAGRLGMLLFVITCGLSANAWAQTPVPSPTPATTKIAFDHDGVNTDGYKIQVDNGEKLPVTATCAVVNTVRTCEIHFPALTPGNHSLVIIAWNIAGEAPSDPFAVTMVVVPAKAINLRIIVR